MEEILNSLKRKIGKEITFSFKVNDDSFLWSEEAELLEYHALSTSALLEEAHRSGYLILKEELSDDFTSVIFSTSLKHLKPTPYSFNVFIKIKIKEIKDNEVVFEGEAFDENEKVAEFKFSRIIISANYLKRKIHEKASKINGYQ